MHQGYYSKYDKEALVMYSKIILLSVVFLIVFTRVLFCPARCEEANLVKNSGFEELAGEMAAGWFTSAYKNTPADVEFLVEEGNACSGKKCLTIINHRLNDSKVEQSITIEPGKTYKVSCWIKTENIMQQAGSANITLFQDEAIYTSQEFADTNGEWRKLEFQIKALENHGNIFRVILRLGGQGTCNKGKASFDDVSVEMVEKSDSAIPMANFFVPGKEGGAASSNEGHKTGTKPSGNNRNLLYIALGAVVLFLVVFIEIKLSRKKGGEAEEDDLEYEEECEECRKNEENADTDCKNKEDEKCDECMNSEQYVANEQEKESIACEETCSNEEGQGN
jgi:hypothetical protein